MSKTEQNLKEAFAGESQANRKYLAFAKQAEQEGYKQVAKLFRAAAEAETVHAHSHLRTLGGVKSTADNLQEAVAGETHEFKSMYPAMIEAAKLSKGQFLSDSDIAALRAANERERAHEYALNLLSYRPRSSAEVTRRLRKKGFSQPTIDTTLERLLRAQLLDDEAFARYWISNRERLDPVGRTLYDTSYAKRASPMA